MKHTISNEYLTAVVDDNGAELQSLKVRDSGRELMWQADARYWDRCAPILFPATGGLWNGTYRMGGKSYPMPKHGFMRDEVWNVLITEKDRLTFVYEGREETKSLFPWDFTLKAEFSLEGKRLVFRLTVENRGQDTLYFQAGGHPGLALDDFSEEEKVADGYLKFTGDDSVVLRAAEQGCTLPDYFPVSHTEDGMVPVCVDTFANEALIFDRNRISKATLYDKHHRPVVSVESDAPVWLIWSPQGEHSPFVCVEPWYGLCDPIGFSGDISRRPYIQILEGGKQWMGGYSLIAE